MAPSHPIKLYIMEYLVSCNVNSHEPKSNIEALHNNHVNDPRFVPCTLVVSGISLYG